MEDSEILKIDLGCGFHKQKGFLGIDICDGDADLIASAEAISLMDCSVDLVHSRRCLQHVKDDVQALREIYRILKIGGILRLQVASWYGWLFYRLTLQGQYPVFNLYFPNKLKAKCLKAGFEILEFSRVPSSRGIGYDFLVVAKK